VGEFLTEDPGFIHLRVGLELLNNTDIPLRYQPDRFAVSLGAATSPLSEAPVETLAGHLSTGWFREPIRYPLKDLPTVVVIDFRFVYGPAGRGMQRAVEGTARGRIPVVVDDLKSGDSRDYPGFVESRAADHPLTAGRRFRLPSFRRH